MSIKFPIDKFIEILFKFWLQDCSIIDFDEFSDTLKYFLSRENKQTDQNIDLKNVEIIKPRIELNINFKISPASKITIKRAQTNRKGIITRKFKQQNLHSSVS